MIQSWRSSPSRAPACFGSPYLSCEARCPAATYIAALWLRGEEQTQTTQPDGYWYSLLQISYLETRQKQEALKHHTFLLPIKANGKAALWGLGD